MSHGMGCKMGQLWAPLSLECVGTQVQSRFLKTSTIGKMHGRFCLNQKGFCQKVTEFKWIYPISYIKEWRKTQNQPYSLCQQSFSASKPTQFLKQNMQTLYDISVNGLRDVKPSMYPQPFVCKARCNTYCIQCNEGGCLDCKDHSRPQFFEIIILHINNRDYHGGCHS